MSEPLTITAGDTATWTRVEADYLASAGWVLTYYLALGATAPKTIQCTASGDDHLALASAQTTAAWAAGDYRWTARVAKSGEVHIVGTGTFKVLPDPSATVDRRSHAERCLEVIEAALLASVGSTTVEYEFEGVKTKKDRSETLRIRDRYRAEVRRERGLPRVSSYPVRLG